MSRICAGVLASLLCAAPAWSQSLAEAARTPLPPQSFGSLFRNLGHDVAQMPSRESALIVGLAAALSAASHHRDAEITASASGNHPLDETLDAGDILGSGWVQIGGALTTYIVGRSKGHTELANTGADLVRAQILDGAITQVVKVAVDRPRPDGSRYSFPSGHTSSAFATAAVLERHYGWKAGLPAYAAAAYVGGSRLSENKHYLSDVIVGAAIGVVCGRATSIGAGRARMAVSPIAAPGGAGVEFTWLGRTPGLGRKSGGA